MPDVLVWDDVETIPDLAGFAAANGHDGKTEDEIARRSQTQYVFTSCNNPQFPRTLPWSDKDVVHSPQWKTFVANAAAKHPSDRSDNEQRAIKRAMEHDVLEESRVRMFVMIRETNCWMRSEDYLWRHQLVPKPYRLHVHSAPGALKPMARPSRYLLEEAVVMLHGFGDTGDMWRPVAAVLVNNHTRPGPARHGALLAPEKGLR
jgi:hypothetical protein